MHLKKLFIASVLSIVVFLSCKKENTAITPPATIEGVWVGKSSVLSEPFNSFYSFKIKAGGVLERVDANGVKTGEGTWAFYNNNEAITGTYTITGGATFSVIATFNKTTGKLDGTWGNGQNNYDGGYWYMNKVN